MEHLHSTPYHIPMIPCWFIARNILKEIYQLLESNAFPVRHAALQVVRPRAGKGWTAEQRQAEDMIFVYFVYVFLIVYTVYMHTVRIYRYILFVFLHPIVYAWDLIIWLVLYPCAFEGSSLWKTSTVKMGNTRCIQVRFFTWWFDMYMYNI